jgi:hypothetical protein
VLAKADIINLYEILGSGILISIILTLIIFLNNNQVGIYGTSDPFEPLSEKSMCFDSADDANKFLNQFVGAGYGYTLTIPCPNHSLLNQTFPEDESGK